jgi:hypothetical protein
VAEGPGFEPGLTESESWPAHSGGRHRRAGARPSARALRVWSEEDRAAEALVGRLEIGNEFRDALKNWPAFSAVNRKSGGSGVCGPDRFKLVGVALANKMARIAFAIMRGKTTYSAAPV